MAVSVEEKIESHILESLYADERLSSWTIANRFGVSRSHVLTLLRQYDIPVRTRAEAHKRYSRRPFDGSCEDKAYLLGFAVGDLRVRKQYKESETIGIACSSTHPAQIALIQNLFSPYGRVWVGEANKSGVVSCEAYMDLSFSFLLPQGRSIDWVFDIPTQFLAFLAGFTDAEGSIFISKQNKAILTWGQYDEQLLTKIKAQLGKLGYQTGSIINDHLKGYRSRDGYVRSQDYFHLTCARQGSLIGLLNALQPYVKHAEKRKGLFKVLATLIARPKNKKYKLLAI